MMPAAADTPLPWVSCPQCATRLPCYDPAGSRYFSCYRCRTYFRAIPDAPEATAHRLDSFRQAPGPALPLGAVGELGGYHCRLTGYQVRSEKSDKTAEWREYQLRPATATGADDPADFPLQLAEYQGHWLLIRRPTEAIQPAGTDYEDASGRRYRRWHHYQPVVRDALGEFDWDILDDEKLQIDEYICPPYLLVKERLGRTKVSWYLAEYLEPEAVAAAFGTRPDRLPMREGIGAAQPGRVPNWPMLSRLAVAGTGLLLVLQLLLVLVLRPAGQVLRQDFVAGAPGPGGSSQMLTSRSFELPRATALNVGLAVPSLDNHWVEVTASLVNEQTGRGYEFTRSVEYYHGYEGGESWSEGGTTADAVLSHVPPGRYHVNLYPTLEPGLRGTDLQLAVERDTPLWTNFWLALGLLATVPLGLGWWRRSFERERWQQSEFNPYPSSDNS